MSQIFEILLFFAHDEGITWNLIVLFLTTIFLVTKLAPSVVGISEAKVPEPNLWRMLLLPTPNTFVKVPREIGT